MIGQQLPDHIANEISASTTSGSAAPQMSSGDGGVSTAGVIILIVLLATTVLAAASYLAVRLHKTRKSGLPSTPNSRGRDLALEADGSTLQAAMKARQNAITTTDDEYDKPPMDPSFTIEEESHSDTEGGTGGEPRTKEVV